MPADDLGGAPGRGGSGYLPGGLMFLFWRAFAAFGLVAPIMLCGSAAAQTAQLPPAELRPIAVVYSNQGPSGWSDLPVGAYRVPNSNVIISGHQKGGALGIIFGPLGIVAQGAVNSEIGKGTVKNTEGSFQVDITQEAAEITQNTLASGRYNQNFALTAEPDESSLSVTPYVAITFVTDTDVRPYVVLKATLNSKRPGEGSRSTRYFCCSGQPLPLTGDNSLTKNGSESLKNIVAQELERAIDVMLDDYSNKFARNRDKLIPLEGNVPFVRNKLKFKGYQLSESDEYIVLDVPGRFVFSGVEILDKAVISRTQ